MMPACELPSGLYENLSVVFVSLRRAFYAIILSQIINILQLMREVLITGRRGTVEVLGHLVSMKVVADSGQ